MKFKIGDVVEDRRWSTIKRVGIVSGISEYETETFITVILVDACSNGVSYTLSGCNNRAVFNPKDLTLLVPAQTDPLFQIAEDIGLAIPEVSHEHTL